jgi:hypothetical protein
VADLGPGGVAALREQTLYSPHFRWADGCRTVQDDDETRWCDATGEVDAISPRGDTYPGVLHFRSQTASAATAELTVRVGKVTSVVDIGPQARDVAIDVTIAPDDNLIRFSVQAPTDAHGDPADRRVGVSDLTVEGPTSG